MEFINAVNHVHSELKALLAEKSRSSLDKKSMAEVAKFPWSWVAVKMAELLKEFTTGLTLTVILCHLETEWESAFIKHSKGFDANFATIQCIYDIPAIRSAALEVVVQDAWQSPNEEEPENRIWLLTLKDRVTSRALDMYVHPKYEEWVSGARISLKAMSRSFIIGRTLRLIVGQRINSPITSNYHDEALLPRIHRIARVPPTELLVFMLTHEDVAFVRNEFPDTLHSLIEPNLFDIPSRKKHRMWLKVVHVEITAHLAPIPAIRTGFEVDKEKQRRTDIYLVDMTPDSEPIMLSLFDEHTQLCTMMKRGDYLGIFDPIFSDRLTASQQQVDYVFEYGSSSVLFLMPDKEAQLAGLGRKDSDSQSSIASKQGSKIKLIDTKEDVKRGLMERDEEGYMDCASYDKRTFICDLEPCMLNVTIFGRITAMACNNPFSKDATPEKMDRYAMRVADATGKMDVTLWDAVGRRARRLRVGQYVLLTRLSTSETHTSPRGPVWYVNGSIVCGTDVFNVSAMQSLLTSHQLRRSISFRERNGRDQWQSLVTVVDWHTKTKEGNECVSMDRGTTSNGQPLGKWVLADAHSACLRQLRRQDQKDRSQVGWCEFCNCNTSNIEPVVTVFHSSQSATQADEAWIVWELDDGDEIILASGKEETFLSVPAHQFLLMSHEEQISLLDGVLGHQYLCALSTTSQDTVVSLDQAVLWRPTQRECQDLYEKVVGHKQQ